MDEDDFSFVDNLLDALQADGEGLSKNDKELEHCLEHAKHFEDVGVFRSACGPLDHASNAAVSTANLDAQTWSSLLTRFCEEGDESMVDTVLDDFLTSKSDVAALIDAIGRDSFISTKPPPAKLERNKPSLQLDLGKVKGPDHDSPSLQMWESLLLSARSLLSSQHASPAGSQCSVKGSPAAESLLAVSPCGDSGGYALPRLSTISAKNCSSNNCGDKSPVRAAHPSKDELMAKIAQFEDLETAKVFVRQFFIGVRRRMVSADAADTAESEEGELNTSADDVRTDSVPVTPSVWSCQSVHTDPDVHS